MISHKILSLGSLYQLGALIVATGLAWLWWPAGVSGVALGGLVMSANFAAARLLATRMLQSDRNRVAYAVGLAGKFVLLLILVSMILTTVQPDLMAFGVGLGTFFVGVGMAVAHQSLWAERLAASPKT